MSSWVGVWPIAKANPPQFICQDQSGPKTSLLFLCIFRREIFGDFKLCNYVQVCVHTSTSTFTTCVLQGNPKCTLLEKEVGKTHTGKKKKTTNPNRIGIRMIKLDFC